MANQIALFKECVPILDEVYDAIGFELNEAIFRSAQERLKERF